MAIPEPSEQDWSEKDGESFLTDPEELWDRLPQPYRMIDKVLDRLLTTVWESIMKRETARSASQKKHPYLILSADTQLPECTNCLACSGDGRFLAVGHAQGLSVSCASSLACISSWLEDGLDITAIQMTGIGQEAYLISTVDDMGVARVLALNAEKIHLLKIVNKTEDINQRNVCVTFDLSEGGDFGAALMSCNGAFWLDIYHFPLESWLEDLKQAAPQSGDVRWTQCSVLMKVTPAKIPTGKTLLSPAELSKKAEVGSGMGSGQNHMIGAHQWKEQDAAFRSKPAMLWPNAQEIVCSAVSQSSRYIALGLEPDLVSVWDRQTGSPLSVVVVSAADSVLNQVMFVECGPVPFSVNAPIPRAPAARQVHLVVSCRSGTTLTLTLTAGASAAVSRAENLRPRSMLSGHENHNAVSNMWMQFQENVQTVQTQKSLNSLHEAHLQIGTLL
ncbi:unnamed protein product [Lota lota]